VDSPRKVRRDLRFLWFYAHTVKHVMSRYSDVGPNAPTIASTVAPAIAPAAVGAGSPAVAPAGEPRQLLARVECELIAECRRMRLMFRAIIAIVLMPFLLAGFLWSGLYWLPIRILWFPFERDMYGLPLFSLFEWFAFLLLAAFLVYSAAMLSEGFASTRRASTAYRQLADASPAEKNVIAQTAALGEFPRALFLLGRAKPFGDYAELLAATPEASA
jgi:hypothetical protein